MMSNNDDFRQFEQKELNNLPNAIPIVKDSLKSSLDDLNVSAIEHTVSLLDTDVINQEIIQESMNNGINQGQGQSNTKEKVRVRTIGGLSPYAAAQSSTSNEPVTNNYSNIGEGSSYQDDSSVWRTGGYTEALILIGTAVLVLLVFMVSYIMLNYFG